MPAIRRMHQDGHEHEIYFLLVEDVSNAAITMGVRAKTSPMRDQVHLIRSILIPLLNLRHGCSSCEEILLPL